MGRLLAWLKAAFAPTLSALLSDFNRLEAKLKAHAEKKLEECDLHELAISAATEAQALARAEAAKALRVAERIRETFL
jgi:hypothetical protein